MTAPKILHIRSSFFYGGPERQIMYLTNALSRQGIVSGVATFAPRSDPARNTYVAKLERLGVLAHRIDIDGSFDRTAVGRLEAVVVDGGYDVLVGHDYRADYFALTIGRRLGLPIFSFSRGWTRTTLRVKLYEWLDIRFLRKMDGVIAVSLKKYAELARRGISPDRLIYIPNSIPINDDAAEKGQIRRRFEIPGDAFLIGTAGRLSVEKNQEMLIAAAVRLLEQAQYSHLRFIIAGEGNRREALARLIPEKYQRKIILAGWIDDNDSFYADLDLFVLTSTTEGFPNVLLEAGRHRLPSISTPAGGAVEIIEDDATGFLIPFGDVDRLCQKIRQVADDGACRRRLAEGLGKITREKFDAAVNAAEFLAFVNRVRERHAKA